MLLPLRETRLQERPQFAGDRCRRVRPRQDQVDLARDLAERHLAFAAVVDEVVEAEGLPVRDPDEPPWTVLIRDLEVFRHGRRDQSGTEPAARRCRSSACAMTVDSISRGATLSSEEWIRDRATSSGPQRTNSASGAACCSVRSSGMDPPEPASLAGLPKASASAHRAAA